MTRSLLLRWAVPEMRYIILATLLLAQSATAQIPGHSSYGIIEHYSGSGPLAGPLAFKVCTQTADDTTPAMGTIPGGCNILETSGANTGACAITTLDGPILPGMMVWVVGTGGAHPTTIADAGNFNLKNTWTGETDRVLELYVQAVGDFVESDRTGGPRVFDDTLTVADSFRSHSIYVSGTGEWTERTHPSGCASLMGIVHGNNLWVAVGGTFSIPSSDAYIITSPDGITWTEQTSPKEMSLKFIAYHDGLFVAVGRDDGVDAYIITSSDGITWTEQTNPKNISLSGVIYGGGQWVACGNADTDTYIITSPNGITWTEQTTPNAGFMVGIGYGNNMWVTVGFNASFSAAEILTSSDGVTWISRGDPGSGYLTSVTYGNNTWVTVGKYDGVDGDIFTSPDGITWTEQTNPKNSILEGVTYAHGLFMAGGSEDTDAYIISSSDGVNWVEELNPKPTRVMELAYARGMWVAVGTGESVGYPDPGWYYTHPYIITRDQNVTVDTHGERFIVEGDTEITGDTQITGQVLIAPNGTLVGMDVSLDSAITAIALEGTPAGITAAARRGANATIAVGVAARCYVESATDTAPCVALQGYSIATNTGDLNVGVLSYAANSSTGNYSFWGIAGDFKNAGDLLLGGDIELTGGGEITSTAAGDITLAPAAGGDTIIDGTSGDFIVNDVAKFAELITGKGASATEVGTYCASENGTGNVCMGGALRVEGISTFGDKILGEVVRSTQLEWNSGYNTISSRVGSGAVISTDSRAGQGNNNLIISEYPNKSLDYGHNTLLPDPTLFPHSVTSPNADNRQYGKLTHNQSAFEIGCGTGYHYFSLDALAANGTITLTANLTANDAFTVGEENAGAGTQFVADTDFVIGATAAATCTNIVAAVNGSAEGAHLTANLNGDTVVFEYDSTGVGGNAAVLTEDVDAGAVFSVTGAGTMTGGRAAVTGSPGHSPNHYFPGIAEVDGNLYVDGAVQGDHKSSDGSAGITDSTSYWLCTAADCATKCQVTIKDGLITGCT